MAGVGRLHVCTRSPDAQPWIRIGSMFARAANMRLLFANRGVKSKQGIIDVLSWHVVQATGLWCSMFASDTNKASMPNPGSDRLKSTPRSGPAASDASLGSRLVGTGPGLLLTNPGWLLGLRARVPILPGYGISECGAPCRLVMMRMAGRGGQEPWQTTPMLSNRATIAPDNGLQPRTGVWSSHRFVVLPDGNCNMASPTGGCCPTIRTGEATWPTL